MGSFIFKLAIGIAIGILISRKELKKIFKSFWGDK